MLRRVCKCPHYLEGRKNVYIKVRTMGYKAQYLSRTTVQCLNIAQFLDHCANFLGVRSGQESVRYWLRPHALNKAVPALQALSLPSVSLAEPSTFALICANRSCSFSRVSAFTPAKSNIQSVGSIRQVTTRLTNGSLTYL